MSAGAQIQAGKAVVKASIDDSQFGSKLVRMQAKFQAFASGIKSAAAGMWHGLTQVLEEARLVWAAGAAR